MEPIENHEVGPTSVFSMLTMTPIEDKYIHLASIHATYKDTV